MCRSMIFPCICGHRSTTPTSTPFSSVSESVATVDEQSSLYAAPAPSKSASHSILFSSSMGRQKWDVVFAGRSPGIFRTWAECQQQVNHFPGCQYKSYPTADDAEEAFDAFCRDHPETKRLAAPPPPQPPAPSGDTLDPAMFVEEEDGTVAVAYDARRRAVVRADTGQCVADGEDYLAALETLHRMHLLELGYRLLLPADAYARLAETCPPALRTAFDRGVGTLNSP